MAVEILHKSLAEIAFFMWPLMLRGGEVFGGDTGSNRINRSVSNGEAGFIGLASQLYGYKIYTREETILISMWDEFGQNDRKEINDVSAIVDF